MDIKRYNIYGREYAGIESETGEVCRYKDVAPIIAERDELKKSNTALIHEIRLKAAERDDANELLRIFEDRLANSLSNLESSERHHKEAAARADECRERAEKAEREASRLRELLKELRNSTYEHAVWKIDAELTRGGSK